MRKYFIPTLLLCCLLAFTNSLRAQEVGTWKAYMSYHEPTWVEKGGDRIYVLASNDLYAYNEKDQSIHTFDKINGLTDTGISHIGWNNSAARLVVIYESGYIDLVDGKDNVVSISDYYNHSMTADKTINSIYNYGKLCYLATGFGIVCLNVAQEEIANTYNLGFSVDYCHIDGGYIYAESKRNGKYRALLTDNLLDKGNWKRMGSYTARNANPDPELMEKAKTLSPGGPKYNHFGFMRFANGKLYTVGGGYGLAELRRPATLQVLDGDEWQVYEDDIAAKTNHQYIDLMCVDVDPNNPSRVFAGGRTGLYEFNNGNFVQEYNIDNTNGCLQAAGTVAADNKDYVIVSGLKFDTSGDLWVFNGISKGSSLSQFTKDGKWVSHHNKAFMDDDNTSLNNGGCLTFDTSGNLWVANNHYNTPALVVFQPSTQGINRYTRFVNEDNAEVNGGGGVRCTAEDKDGNIWAGLNGGPVYLRPSDLSTDPNSVLFQQYKVPRNDGSNLADYLLTNIDITCMAVDGGNRKWFGTGGNGVYLISADLNTQVHHFLSSNSGLVSDNIESLAINPTTGEVYIGTDKGLCSYLSDASEPVQTMDKETTYAYPNPVRPDYRGIITITGLSYNADVKIVTSSGTLVAEGTSQGGMFTWDGNNLKGKRVASGIYMVEAATEDGSSGVVCKIAVIN